MAIHIYNQKKNDRIDSRTYQTKSSQFLESPEKFAEVLLPTIDLNLK